MPELAARAQQRQESCRALSRHRRYRTEETRDWESDRCVSSRSRWAREGKKPVERGLEEREGSSTLSRIPRSHATRIMRERRDPFPTFLPFIDEPEIRNVISSPFSNREGWSVSTEVAAVRRNAETSSSFLTRAPDKSRPPFSPPSFSREGVAGDARFVEN